MGFEPISPHIARNLPVDIRSHVARLSGLPDRGTVLLDDCHIRNYNITV